MNDLLPSSKEVSFLTEIVQREKAAEALYDRVKEAKPRLREFLADSCMEILPGVPDALPAWEVPTYAPVGLFHEGTQWRGGISVISLQA